jgi:hypothetical protein
MSLEYHAGTSYLDKKVVLSVAAREGVVNFGHAPAVIKDARKVLVEPPQPERANAR